MDKQRLTKKYTLKKIDTPNKAYLIGFICGDASFSTTNIMDLKVAIKDREVLEFISKETGATIKDSLVFDKKRKVFPSARLRVKIPDVFTFIKERLKKGRNLPIVSKQLNPYLIQGFFDAEGCITWGYRKDRGRLWQKVSFTSSLSLLEALQKLLLKYGISTIVKPKSAGDCYVLEFSNEIDVLNFLRILPSDSFFLKRKRHNYLLWLDAVRQKYQFKIGDTVEFVDIRTLKKYNIPFVKLYKGKFKIKSIEGELCSLSNGSTVSPMLLTKKGISNYALRLELDGFGGTVKDTIPSRASNHFEEGVETTGEKLDSLNNQ